MSRRLVSLTILPITMRLGRRSRSRLVAILCISLFVVLIQIITVSRLSTPNKYPWEDDEMVKSGPVYTKRSAEDYRKGARNTLEVSCTICDTTVFQMHDPALEMEINHYGSRKLVPSLQCNVMYMYFFSKIELIYLFWYHLYLQCILCVISEQK